MSKKIIPKISIILPVYNAESYIKETLDSLLNQSFKDFEIISVVNGSKDNSLKILREYQKKDKRIIIKILSQPDVVKAMNFGLGFAKGKYISKVDSDDVYLSNKLETQFNYLEKHPDIFLVGSSATVIDENGKKIGIFKKYNCPSRIKKKLMKSNPFIHSSIFYRNIPGLLYRDKFLISEEYDLFLRLLEEKKVLTNLPDILMKYRIRSNSIMSTRPNQRYFFDKAKEFYLQRKKSGKDKYNSLKSPTQTQKPQDFQKFYLNTKIAVEFQDNQMKLVRENIKLYSKNYGLNKTLVIFYLLSFFPQKFIELLREKVL